MSTNFVRAPRAFAISIGTAAALAGLASPAAAVTVAADAPSNVVVGCEEWGVARMRCTATWTGGEDVETGVWTPWRNSRTILTSSINPTTNSATALVGCTAPSQAQVIFTVTDSLGRSADGLGEGPCYRILP